MNPEPVIHVGRKSKVILAASLLVLLLTCYFCWEILYQERVILSTLKMAGFRVPVEGSHPDGIDHLEEVVDVWLQQQQQQQREVLHEESADVSTKANIYSMTKHIFKVSALEIGRVESFDVVHVVSAEDE